ncbi:hypothetical protein PsYK624_172440 [Phanerochaete sordida]|uniref:Uncharacterized protein n=1 Tax=Phanerochaete sordida TaxID=48140 RepID=A0A9P3GZ20_9APHY|nr:hypothetical protein PsYK624_172440 [Phanerochaete sordida]
MRVSAVRSRLIRRVDLSSPAIALALSIDNDLQASASSTSPTPPSQGRLSDVRTASSRWNCAVPSTTLRPDARTTTSAVWRSREDLCMAHLAVIEVLIYTHRAIAVVQASTSSSSSRKPRVHAAQAWPPQPICERGGDIDTGAWQGASEGMLTFGA